MAFANARGEMYPFVTHTHNPVKGGCWSILHGYGCRYCFVGIKDLGRGKYSGPLTLYPDELECQYKPGKTYFIGSATDMWHDSVSDDDIGRVLSNCQLWQNQCPASLQKPDFLFQSKNPVRLCRFAGEIPFGSMLATTYETDDEELYGDTSRAPKPHQRLQAMENLHDIAGDSYNLMLSIEPVMKPKHLDRFIDKIVRIPWSLISIGADSCEAIAREKQPEPGFISQLASALSECRSVGQVVVKSNCANLADSMAQDFLDYWDANGWIYHRPSRKAKGPIQESFL